MQWIVDGHNNTVNFKGHGLPYQSDMSHCYIILATTTYVNHFYTMPID